MEQGNRTAKSKKYPTGNHFFFPMHISILSLFIHFLEWESALFLKDMRFFIAALLHWNRISQDRFGQPPQTRQHTQLLKASANTKCLY